MKTRVYYVKTRISDNISETPDGYLLCLNVPLTHTGKMVYAPGEHPFEDIDILEVTRTKDEIHSDKTIGSLIGKSVTIQHPQDFVSPENWQKLTHGTIVNVRPSPEQIEVDGEMVDALLGDLMITTEEAIQEVRDGLREVSIGYDAVWVQVEEKKAVQKNIIGNHVALVDTGRAGDKFSIKDSGDKVKKLGTIDQIKAQYKKLFGKGLDEAMAEKEKEVKKDEPAKDEVAEIESQITDLQSKLEAAKKAKEDKAADETPAGEQQASSGVEAKLDKLISLMEKLFAAEATEDNEDPVLEVEDEADTDLDEDEEEREVNAKDAKGGDSFQHDDETIANAEILAPGIALTKDVKKKALEVAYKTTDGKKIIDKLTASKGVAAIPDANVDVIFSAASELMKTKRTDDFSHSSARATALDAFPSVAHSGMTADEINKKNAAHYSKKN